MLLTCKYCGITSTSSPFKSSRTKVSICYTCRKNRPEDAVQRMTIAATVVSFREVKRGSHTLKFFLKSK